MNAAPGALGVGAPREASECALPAGVAPVGVPVAFAFVAGLAVSFLAVTYAAARGMGFALEMAADADAVSLGGAALLILGLAIYALQVRWIAVFAAAFAGHLRERRRPTEPVRRWPSVTVSVPARNEAAGIESALASLVRLDYPSYEVVVVDDGSTDETLALARRFEGEHGPCTVRVLAKPNGGKWSAHNLAFRRSRGELFLCVDADTRLEPDALRRLAERMNDPGVASVSGQVRVRNRVNALTWLQALEYIHPSGLVRMAQGLSGTVLVVPGPIGIFRRKALEEVAARYGRPGGPESPGRVAGPFQGDTFCEDFDLSLAILSLGGKIFYAPEAVAHTRVPDWPFGLLNQRYRWVRGNVQVLRKFFRRAAETEAARSPRVLAWVALVAVLETFVTPVVNLAGIGAFLAFLGAQGYAGPLLGWVAASAIADLNMAAFTAAAHKETPRILALLPFLSAYQFFILNIGWAFAVLDEARGVGMRW